MSQSDGRALQETAWKDLMKELSFAKPMEILKASNWEALHMISLDKDVAGIVIVLLYNRQSLNWLYIPYLSLWWVKLSSWRDQNLLVRQSDLLRNFLHHQRPLLSNMFEIIQQAPVKSPVSNPLSKSVDYEVGKSNECQEQKHSPDQQNYAYCDGRWFLCCISFASGSGASIVSR